MMTANKPADKPTSGNARKLNAKSVNPTRSTTIQKMQSTMRAKLLWIMILLITAGCHRSQADAYKRYQKKEVRKAERQAKRFYYKARLYQVTHPQQW